MRENELKFAPPATFALPEFEDSTGVAVVEKLPAQNLRAVYYDTLDLRLSRLGATLRHRTGEQDHAVWTLKLPIPGDHGTAREEIDSKVEGRSPPPEITDLTTAFIRSDKLVPVTTLKTKRRRWMLRAGSGLEIAELVDDDVSVIEGRKIVGRFRELEVEQKNATGKQLKRIAEALRKAGAVDAEPIPKASRALALRGNPTEEPSTPIEDGSARAALARYIAREVDRLILNDPVVRLGRQSEGVHQMRVATRRIRSNIKTFGEMLDRPWAEETAMDLKWLAGLLGEVRDLDVLQERFRDHAMDIEGLKPLFDSLTRQHRRARSRLLDAMRSDRYRLLVETLVQAGQSVPTTDLAEGAARQTMGATVATMWSELASEVRSLGDETADDQRHEVRIQTKRLRYAVEAVSPYFAERDKARRFEARLADLQDALGENQDAAVAQDTLVAVATRGSKDPLFCIAIGRVIEREKRGALNSRAMFSEVWGKLDRKKNLTWLQG